uniref:Uncharacterized protein n=2 Tax=Lepeophtheirus salmonis TaxID=72036 RepID=A0A0K2UMM2_LEPSM
MAASLGKYDEFGLPLISDEDLNSRLNKLSTNFNNILTSSSSSSSVANLEMPKIIDISHPPPLMVLPNWKANTGTSETESVKSSQSPVDNSNCVLPFRPIPEKSIKSIKNWTREWMWDFLERSSSILSNFPRPCYGEIPNYQNSKSAAILFSRSKTFESAKVVLLSPSASLTYMRELCLRSKKVIYFRQTDFKTDQFLWRVDPNKLKKDVDYVLASTTRGLKTFGKPIKCRKKFFHEKIDLVIVGSVAVNKSGARIDTGTGQTDLEWAILHELGVVEAKNITVATIVDCVQILDESVLPNSVMQKQDLPADVIVTKKCITHVKNRFKKPDKGILPNLCSNEMLKQYPAIKHFV